MKKFLLITLCSIITLCLMAQTIYDVKRYIIIEGYFFDEIPVSTDNITKIHSLQTPGGTTAWVMVFSEPLPHEAIKYAIPKEQVPEGDLLLERYHEAIENSMGISLAIAENTLNEGEKFPQFVATDIDGKEWSNDDVKGKVMVLNLWFTGCAPCRAEMPELSTWKDEMPDVMFFSSTYENANRAKPILEAQKFNWIPLVNDTQFKKYVGAKGYPMTIVIDKNGIIAKIEYGTSPTQREELKATIQQLR